jgi:dTDP-4-dehydrorhamnose reductase
LCEKINSIGTSYIAKECAKLGCKMIYPSTDYVFNGEGTRPWEPDDSREPLNVYGKYKYEGELAVQKYLSKYFIVRISWVFGKHGKNFVDTMCRLGNERDEITVVDDQVGSPTYTWDLSRLLIDMAETDKYGIYHATNEGFCSWYEFAKEIFRIKGMSVKVKPVSSDQYPAKAKRPANSRMNKQKLLEQGFEPLPDWKDAVKRYLEEK